MKSAQLFQNLSLQQEQLNTLEPIVEALLRENRLESKLQILQNLPWVKEREARFAARLKQCSSLEKTYAAYALFSLKQGDSFFLSCPHLDFLDPLLKVEELYAPIGGIIGYHLQFLKQLIHKETSCPVETGEIQPPPGIVLEERPDYKRTVIKEGLLNLHSFAELYPVAGAADRLNLHDEATKEPLPAAQLNFLGVTLLEGLIRDLQAREYLLFKLTGKRLTVPVVMMTSAEKNNHTHVTSICNLNDWFGRDPKSFFFIKQPLAPVISEEGEWVTKSESHFALKPGGHGVIWKLAEEQGALKFLSKRGKHHLIVRQINNPIAGLDALLLCMAGVGSLEKREFGFASCDRLVKSAEGMNVLMEHKIAENRYSYKITNIEYTDFSMHGIEDCPSTAGGKYSLFPANTNVLYANIRSIRKALKTNPFPCMLINLKERMHLNGREVSVGRLESIMQNIADSIVSVHDHKLNDAEKMALPTFVLFNPRDQTISTTKKSHAPGKSIQETPEGAYYTLMMNRLQLLQDCGFEVPPPSSEEEYLLSGPSCIFLHHPALGPLHEIVQMKLRGGRIAKGAELQLELAEADIENLELNGSLLIQALSPLGHCSANGRILYSDKGGKCTLKNVQVVNQGIDRSIRQTYWKNGLSRKESLRIVIEGDGEFIAENVRFQGAHEIFVPKGFRMRALQEGNLVKFSLEKIQAPTWHWKYIFDNDNSIDLLLTF